MGEPCKPSTSTKESTEYVFIERKGGTLLLSNGYQYTWKRQNKNDITVWECHLRKKEKCPGYLKMQMREQKVVDEKKHTCVQNYMKNDIDLAVEKCKENIIAPEFPGVPTQHNKMVAGFTDYGMEMAYDIPKFTSIKSTLYRKRNLQAKVTKLKCNKADEVEVPPKYHTFLLADYSSNDTRIIVFASQYARTLINAVEDYLGDGTFFCCPDPFEQLYTIHGDVGSTDTESNIMPLIYAFMSSRDTEAYIILFSLIKSQLPQWSPKTFKTDFESATMKAIRKFLPDATLKGCYFHFTKSIWKKARQLELLKKSDDTKIREVALSAVLPLLPPTEILNGWTYITRKDSEDPNCLKFRKYMERQWLNDTDFIAVWCAFKERHRTTNCLEAWHKQLKQSVGKKKPNIMLILEKLQEDASYHKVVHECKRSLKSRSQKHIRRDQFIQDCQLELVNGEINVGHFLEMVRR